MVTLRDEGKFGAIGISNIPLDVLRRALPAGIVCVQDSYVLLNRSQEDLLNVCVNEGIAWVPCFPLGSSFPGFPKVSADPVAVAIAAEIGATPSQVGLGWLLAHTPNTLLIAGTPFGEPPRGECRRRVWVVSLPVASMVTAVGGGCKPPAWTEFRGVHCLHRFHGWFLCSVMRDGQEVLWHRLLSSPESVSDEMRCSASVLVIAGAIPVSMGRRGGVRCAESKTCRRNSASARGSGGLDTSRPLWSADCSQSL
jgi:hypothetical protein